MSKLFDEYVAKKKKVVGSTYFISTENKIVPMILKTQVEKELENELDDRLLISIVIMQTNNGMSLEEIIDTYKKINKVKIGLFDETEEDEHYKKEAQAMKIRQFINDESEETKRELEKKVEEFKKIACGEFKKYEERKQKVKEVSQQLSKFFDDNRESIKEQVLNTKPSTRAEDEMRTSFTISSEAEDTLIEKFTEFYNKQKKKGERAIRLIEAVYRLTKSNEKFTYGDLKLLVDDDPTELEYEASKKEGTEKITSAQTQKKA